MTPLLLDRGACPVCGGPYYRSRTGSTWLYVCDGGCPGVAVAARLGLPLDDEESPFPGRRTLRAVVQRHPRASPY